MKALIQKDFYVIWKQMRIFVVIILLLSIMNSAFNIVFLVVWCSMLPYTAMAYDERSHWNQLAAMMPYSRRDVVLSKYVLGWLCMAAASILCLAARVVLGHFLENEVDTSIVLTSLCLGVISLDITLPAVMRFGVERGRMIFMVVIFGAALGAGVALDSVDIPSVPLPVMALLPLAAVVLTAVSIPLSMKLYQVN
ncbi:ABC-2 transporter permease [uncultured Oscillibacter sp.]|uniref:ABC-2 transporter permease n=1 Tax=uncultured Oscillibacter sp. TaxID=876091 RepID=UPI0026127ED0|nr:ABC-2 transporter permease [uncultured Oscillibacter sp.]